MGITLPPIQPRFKLGQRVYLPTRNRFAVIASEEKRDKMFPEQGYGWEIIVPGYAWSVWFAGPEIQHAYPGMEIGEILPLYRGNKITMVNQVCPGRYTVEMQRFPGEDFAESFEVRGETFLYRETLKWGFIRSTFIFDHKIKVSPEMRADAQRTIDAMAVRYDRIQTIEQTRQGEFKGLTP
jgi:hypothetical protein